MCIRRKWAVSGFRRRSREEEFARRPKEELTPIDVAQERREGREDDVGGGSSQNGHS